MLTTRNTTRRPRATAAAAAFCVAALLAGCTPPGPRALLDGERLLQDGRPEEAVRRLRTAVELLPANAQAWNHLGLALHAAKQPGDAAQAYREALRLDRNLAVAHYNLGCLWLEQGETVKAIDAFRTHVGLAPQSFDGWLKLGQAQLRSRQWEPADRSFTAALRLAPRDPEALNGLGVSHQQRRHNREAWSCFTNAIGQNPRFAPAWLNLAVVAHQAGARPQAIQAYRQYVTLRPDAARALGLDTVLQQLEGTPKSPVISLPPLTATNPPAAATPAGPLTNRPVAAPGVATNRASVAPTAPPAAIRPAAATNPPAQPRSPPRRAEVDRPASGTVTSTVPAVADTGTPPASPPTNLTSTPVPPPSPTVPPSPAPVSNPPPATSPAPVAAVARIVPPAPAPEPSSNRPAPSIVTVPVSSPATSAPAPAQPAVATVVSPAPSPKPVTPATPTPEALTNAPIIPAEPAFEVVQVAPPPEPLVTNLQDETPRPRETPASTVPRMATAPAEPPPLIRPVAAQHGSESADRRGFWNRANPVRWFGSEKGDAVAPAEPVVDAESPSDEERSRWRWANPVSWFKSGETRGETVTNVVRAPRIEPVPPAPAPASATPAPTPAPARAPAPAIATVTPATPRYRYLRPAAPTAGDRAAAEPVVAEAIREHTRGDLNTAVKLYTQAVRLDPSSFEAQQYLATALLQSGAPAKALPPAETALALRPASATARLNLALALDAAGYPNDAAAEAARITAAKDSEGGPTKADRVAAHLLLGNLNARKLNQPEQARENYLRVLELEPEHPQNTAIRRWLAGRR